MSASPTSAADRYGFAFNTDFSGWTAPQEDAGARRDSQRQPSGLQLDAAQLQSSTRATPVEWDRRTNSHQSGNDGSINPRNSVLQQDGVGGPGPSSSLAASRFFSGHQLGQGASLRLLGMQDDDDEEGDNEDDQDKAEGSGNSGPSTSNIGVGSLPNDSSASKAEQATKKKAGGRPRDFIWKYYEDRTVEGKRNATCVFCGNRQEMPKAFRMRQHIIACANSPEDAKVLVRLEQQRKDEDARVKKALASRKQTISAQELAEASMGNAGQASGSFDLQGDAASLSAYGLPSLPLLPLPNGDSERAVSDDETAESAAGKRKAPNGPAKERKRGKKDETFLGYLDDRIMSPAQSARSPVTCHVLDSTAGKPGSNVRIRLDQLGQTGFVHVASGETDSDGRNGSLLTPGTSIAKNSIFKLTFYTKDYWTAKSVESFYPFVEVVFEIKEPSEHHHIALMLSPFAYTTYRGS